MEKYSGTFITFEGIDYSGKSVQSGLLKDFLEQQQKSCVLLRDPGATRISEKIRNILLDNEHHEMTKWAELLLYEAARAQMVEETILPALMDGNIVICDRFYDSTTAYQGHGRQLDIDMVQRANSIGSCGLDPDITFLIDLDVDAAVKRRLDAGQSADRLESAGLDFQKRVRNGYLAIAENEMERFKVIDGSNTIDEIALKIKQAINSFI